MKRPAKDWAFFFGVLAAFIVVVSVCAWMFGHLADRRATIYKEGYDAGLEEGLGRSDYSQYNKGFSDGEKSAYHAFSKEDYAEGYEAGYETGSEKGYTDGYSDGHFDGYREGYDKGYLNGYEIGEENGRDDADAGKADNPDWKESAAERGYIEKWW